MHGPTVVVNMLQRRSVCPQKLINLGENVGLFNWKLEILTWLDLRDPFLAVYGSLFYFR
jgi:hypothetical protein